MKTQCFITTTSIVLMAIVCSLMFPVTISAGTVKDVVHLKDGSVLQGEIIEQVPGESLKIEIADGSIFNLTMDRIAKITKITIADGKPFVVLELGAGFLALGGDVGKLYDNTVGIPIGLYFRIQDKAEVGLQYLQSSEFNDIGESLGIFNGPDMYFGDVQAVFRYSSRLGGVNSKLGTYYSLGVGITHLKIDGKTIGDFEFPEIQEDKLSFSIATGLKLSFTKNFGMHLGARYSNISTEFASMNHFLLGFGLDIGMGTF